MGSNTICKYTVMDESFPGIIFDNQNICDLYWDFQKNIKPYWNPSSKTYDDLNKMIDRIKLDGKNNDYDCLLGISGGIDSSYLLHTVVNDFNLRPLVFHVDGGWNSEEATHNINALINKLNLDLFTEVIDWNEMRNFQLALFKSGVPHLDIPQDMAFISTLYKFANKHKIKYIMNGGNVSTESITTPFKYFYWGTDMTQIRDILKQFGEAISSKFIPPKLAEKFFILLIISSGSLDSISKSIASMSANLLNKTALPSITGFAAKAPRFPRPNIADPLLITATKLPFVV